MCLPESIRRNERSAIQSHLPYTTIQPYTTLPQRRTSGAAPRLPLLRRYLRACESLVADTLPELPGAPRLRRFAETGGDRGFAMPERVGD